MSEEDSSLIARTQNLQRTAGEGVAWVMITTLEKRRYYWHHGDGTTHWSLPIGTLRGGVRVITGYHVESQSGVRGRARGEVAP